MKTQIAALFAFLLLAAALLGAVGADFALSGNPETRPAVQVEPQMPARDRTSFLRECRALRD